MGSAWSQIFGGDDGMNRAERRAADREWNRMMRRQRRARARAARAQEKGEQDAGRR